VTAIQTSVLKVQVATATTLTTTEFDILKRPFIYQIQNITLILRIDTLLHFLALPAD
jgi:hypothetical protein